MQSQSQSHLLTRISLHSAKRPTFYLIAGILFILFSYADNFFHLPDWENLFSISNKLGNILIVLALITFIYNMMSFLCLRFERKLADDRKVASLILTSLRKSLRLIFVLIAINIIISLLNPTEFYLSLANNIINSVIIASIGWIVIQAFYTTEAVFYEYMITLNEKEHLRVQALYTKMHILRNIATVAVVIVTVAAILMSFNSVKNIGISLLASAGFLTAIIGLSAQKTLFSMFSGLQIAMAQTIKIGDIVTIENQTGTIEEITFTYVTLKLIDKRRLVIPISYFIDKPFENWSQENGMLNSFVLLINHLIPIPQLREKFQTILHESAYWDKTAGKLEVVDVNDKGVRIRIQLSAANADNLGTLCAEVKERLLDFMRTYYDPKQRETETN